MGLEMGMGMEWFPGEKGWGVEDSFSCANGIYVVYFQVGSQKLGTTNQSNLAENIFFF